VGARPRSASCEWPVGAAAWKPGANHVTTGVETSCLDSARRLSCELALQLASPSRAAHWQLRLTSEYCLHTSYSRWRRSSTTELAQSLHSRAAIPRLGMVGARRSSPYRFPPSRWLDENGALVLRYVAASGTPAPLHAPYPTREPGSRAESV